MLHYPIPEDSLLIENMFQLVSYCVMSKTDLKILHLMAV